MKTKSDIKDLNFQDYAFFKGVPLLDAKWEFAHRIFTTDNLEDNLTKTGIPKIGVNDRLPVTDFNFSMRANSLLDGESQFNYLCEYYNKGVPLNLLREWSEKESFIKAMKFTGKFSIANDILNPDQILKLQKTWLLKNSYYSIREIAIKFELKNKWAYAYMQENGVDMDKYKKVKEKYIEENAPKKLYQQQ